MWLYSCNDVPAGFLYFKVIYAGWCETASATSTYNCCSIMRDCVPA